MGHNLTIWLHWIGVATNHEPVTWNLLVRLSFALAHLKTHQMYCKGCAVNLSDTEDIQRSHRD